MIIDFHKLSRAWVAALIRFPLIILAAALILTMLSMAGATRLTVSTKLEALMPKNAPSVQTLERALSKTGSFASVQVVARSTEPATTLRFIREIQPIIEQFDWVGSTQYFEDISVFEKHKLVLMDGDELTTIERQVEAHIMSALARKLESAAGAPVTVKLRQQGLSGDSREADTLFKLSDEAEPGGRQKEGKRLFASQDLRTVALVIWPRNDLTGLGDARRMVTDVEAAVRSLDPDQYGDGLRAGAAGRIKNKVAQFEATMTDAQLSLAGSVSLIILFLALSFRSLAAVPLVLIPLVMGIVWTIGLTAVTVGALNLITVFLALILFGLGIDFGIHNFARYQEARRSGMDVEASLQVVIVRTGSASLVAALTSALGFYSLTLTEFRAFAEFGFIAGSGILLIFLSMYSVFPALVVVFERHTTWLARLPSAPPARRRWKGWTPRPIPVPAVLVCTAMVTAAALYFSFDLEFEKNFKNLQAERSQEHKWASGEARRVFPRGHDRAIVVVDTLDELIAVDRYFEEKIEADRETPTIAGVSSILDFIPAPGEQKRRLENIDRIKERFGGIGALDESYAEVIAPLLDAGPLETSELPEALRRTYLGVESDPGYLLYIYNSVTMDDADLARLFYDDAAGFVLDGRKYASASEGFIFVEMIALMKADAIKAIALVTLATTLVVFAFFRSVGATIMVLAPSLTGILLTLGLMGALDVRLSIINMVILPSLVGISVDNAIHIYHRFREAGDAADVASIMRTTGRAAVMTTLTTLLGFGGLLTSSMGGLRSMGLVAVIGFLSCLVVTVTLLPALLRLRLKSGHLAQAAK